MCVKKKVKAGESGRRTRKEKREKSAGRSAVGREVCRLTQHCTPESEHVQNTAFLDVLTIDPNHTPLYSRLTLRRSVT